MAYYNKLDVEKYIKDNNQKLENKGHKSITPVQQSLSQLETEENIVGYFWMDINEGQGVDGAKIGMGGKTFVRIDFNLYTDDRFAIDLFQSQNESITVSEVIKRRLIDQERAKKSIEENKLDLEESLVKKINKE